MRPDLGEFFARQAYTGARPLGQEIRQVANNFDRSYMRLSKNSLEEVLSAIRDFDPDFQAFILSGTALPD